MFRLVKPLPPCNQCGKPTANLKSRVCEECKKERAALILYTMNTRSMRLSRLRSALFWIAGLSLLYPLLLAVLWAMDPYRVPFEAALPLYLEMIRADAWQPAIGATA
ncbi:hypothetical protein, partial [Klebsiella pneumoniae]|uniref:hypothetical protein n=1 Tax=Klebsiella pneumoniae TaxID=573 RepID=UPI003F760A79